MLGSQLVNFSSERLCHLFEARLVKLLIGEEVRAVPCLVRKLSEQRLNRVACAHVGRFPTFLLQTRHCFFLFGLDLQVNLLEHLVFFDFVNQTHLARRLLQRAWRQIQINVVYLLLQLAFVMRKNQIASKFFPVSFVSAVVLDLDVQIERAFAPVVLVTVLVRTDETSLDLLGRPPNMLLAHLDLLAAFALLVV